MNVTLLLEVVKNLKILKNAFVSTAFFLKITFFNFDK